MAVHAVHWHEGMFLWPHQMQLAERFYLQQIHRHARFDQHYGWGLRLLDWDPQALTNHCFVVRSLRACLRDGTLVCVPEESSLPSLDIKEAFGRENTATIYLAVPVLQEGKPNTSLRLESSTEKKEDQQAVSTRYLLETQDLEDENTGADSAPIQVRFLNVKLLHSHQDLSGYEVLPIARLEKSSQGDGLPRLDTTYIPPLLACDAWKPLQAGILQAIFDRLGRKMDLFSKQVASRGISFDTRNPGDGLLLAQLHALNKAYPQLNIVGFAEGFHPLGAYTELCRLAGTLAIFSDTRKAPQLPPYDHDDLGRCFYAVKQYIETIDITEPSYEERPFIGKGLRMQVDLEPKWLEPSWEIFVGVQTDLSADECYRMLTRQGLLDMKIGSSIKVDDIFDRGSQGLEFTPCPRPPRVLPTPPGLAYFQINRASKQDEWLNVQKSLSLAIRVNPSRIIGNIEGQREITIRRSDELKSLQFTLYLAQKES